MRLFSSRNEDAEGKSGGSLISVATRLHWLHQFDLGDDAAEETTPFAHSLVFPSHQKHVNRERL